MDSFGQQENDEMYEEMVEESDGSDSDHCETGYNTNLDPLGTVNTSSNETTFFSDEAINENIRSPNDEQRKLFLYKWLRDCIKSVGSKLSHTYSKTILCFADWWCRSW